MIALRKIQIVDSKTFVRPTHHYRGLQMQGPDMQYRKAGTTFFPKNDIELHHA